MLDLYATVKAPSVEPGPSGLVDLVWEGPRGQRIILSMTQKQARKMLIRIAEAFDEPPPRTEPDPGQPGVGGPS